MIVFHTRTFVTFETQDQVFLITETKFVNTEFLKPILIYWIFKTNFSVTELVESNFWITEFLSPNFPWPTFLKSDFFIKEFSTSKFPWLYLLRDNLKIFFSITEVSLRNSLKATFPNTALYSIHNYQKGQKSQFYQQLRSKWHMHRDKKAIIHDQMIKTVSRDKRKTPGLITRVAGYRLETRRCMANMQLFSGVKRVRSSITRLNGLDDEYLNKLGPCSQKCPPKNGVSKRKNRP